MTKLKSLIAVLLFFAFMCSFAGCGPERSPQEENTVESSTHQKVTTAEPDQPIDPNAPVVFLKSDVAKFKIVYADELLEECRYHGHR